MDRNVYPLKATWLLAPRPTRGREDREASALQEEIRQGLGSQAELLFIPALNRERRVYFEDLVALVRTTARFPSGAIAGSVENRPGSEFETTRNETVWQDSWGGPAPTFVALLANTREPLFSSTVALVAARLKVGG